LGPTMIALVRKLRVLVALALAVGAVLLSSVSFLSSGYTYDYVRTLDPSAIGLVSLFLLPLPLSLILWNQRLTRRTTLWWTLWGVTVLLGLAGAYALLALNVLGAAIRRDGFIP
jgi:hypothetical protein